LPTTDIVFEIVSGSRAHGPLRQQFLDSRLPAVRRLIGEASAAAVSGHT
jgi:hypothetical protein